MLSSQGEALALSKLDLAESIVSSVSYLPPTKFVAT
jgi:hypothetical protein